MDTITQRIAQADELWTLGSVAEQNNDLTSAYELYTRAHDLIMDCAVLHQRAHEELRRVNFEIGNYGELATDWLLHFFAPLRVFELISYLSRSDAFGSILCKR
jgi:hypothetical protein